MKFHLLFRFPAFSPGPPRLGRSGRRSQLLVSLRLGGVWPRNQAITLLAIAHVLAVCAFTNANPRWLLAVRADELYVRDMQRRFHFDDAGLPRSAPFDVFLDDIDAFDNDTVP